MKIKSKVLNLRSADRVDADFIYDLRIKRGKFLNNKDFSREGNKNWLSKYPEKEKEGKEYYFVIFDAKEDIGVVRVYDIDYKKKTFVWGSWVLKENCSPRYSLISAILTYAFAFGFLKMEKALFDVRNENKRVISFHESSGAKFLRKDDTDTYYVFDKEAYRKLQNKYDKFVGKISYERGC